MRLHRFVATSLSLAALVSPASHGAGGTSYGTASGSINLPGGGNANGLDGLFVRYGGAQVFTVDAHFHELDQPDPQHRTGIIHGHIFDGSGPYAAYIMYGHWTLDIATGDGHFYAPIYDPEHVFETPVGRIASDFHEPTGDPTPGLGSFRAEWGLSW